MIKKIFIIILVILFILEIGGLIYAHIRLYQVTKDNHKSIDWECMIWCISIFLMEILFVLAVIFSAK